MMDPYDKPPGYGPGQPGPSGVAVCPTAPNINEGYEEDIGVEKPPTAPPYEIPTPDRIPLVNLGSLTEDEVREACIQYASENCCYGKKFARETEIKETSNTYTYHYQLETFGEKRETALRSEPFRGQIIDGPENGPPPGPWDMVITIPEMFRDMQIKAEVPHTAYVKECVKCVGNCRVRCESCSGRGGSTCFSCSGLGRRNNELCSSCYGTGRSRCWSCSGTGQVTCSMCDGKGRLKHYKLLIVTWKNHVDYFISNAGTLPRELILKVSGREVFKEQGIRVVPINHSTNPTVNDASREFITKHERAFPYEIIRMQKQVLRAIPMSRNNYSWKNKTGEFYVYGFEKKVYFENYPQKCCCCTCL